MTVTLYIDPPSSHFEHNRLFDMEMARFAGADLLAPYVRLRSALGERGVSVQTADALERSEGLGTDNAYVSLGIRRRYPSLAGRDDVVLSALLAMECPIVEPELYADLPQASSYFKRILSYSTSTALLPFTGEPVDVRRFRIPQSFDAVHEELWANTDRRFVAMINGNKLPRLRTSELYTERMRAVEFFERRGEIDLYGVGWDGPPYRVGTRLPGPLQVLLRAAETAKYRARPAPLLAAAARAWRGRVADKARTLGNYKFAVCFENMILPGWITEKLFDCLYAGTVPIYLGAPDVADWLPEDCFIDMRRFDGYADLRDHLLSIGDTGLRAHREAARNFIGSDAFRPFSIDQYVEMFAGLLERDLGIRV